MLLRIIGKEILEHLMSLRFAIACVLCFTVILASLFVRGEEYMLVAGDYREESVALKYDMEKMDHPWMIVWRGITVNQAPNPLKVFVRGVEEGRQGRQRRQGRELYTPGRKDRRAGRGQLRIRLCGP